MKIDFVKILEIFNGLNEQLRYSILGSIVVLFLLLDAFLLVLPQWGSITQVNDQIKTMTTDTAQVLNDTQRINQIRRNLEKTRSQLNAMNTKMRSLQEVPAILETISKIANEYDVKIDQLMPQKEGQESLTKTADGPYYALPIVIQARCGYHMFGHFLNQLENENVYFIVKSLLVQNDEKTPAMDLFSVTIDLILVDKEKPQLKKL